MIFLLDILSALVVKYAVTTRTTDSTQLINSTEHLDWGSSITLRFDDKSAKSSLACFHVPNVHHWPFSICVAQQDTSPIAGLIKLLAPPLYKVHGSVGCITPTNPLRIPQCNFELCAVYSRAAHVSRTFHKTLPLRQHQHIVWKHPQWCCCLKITIIAHNYILPSLLCFPIFKKKHKFGFTLEHLEAEEGLVLVLFYIQCSSQI